MSGEALTVTIEKLVQGGRGLAHHGSKVVLVRGAIPSETVAVSGGSVHKGYQEATVKDVLVASPDRVVPPCAIYGECGGCQFQHIRYAAQLEQKRQILRETLVRVGKMQVEDIPAVHPSPTPYGYRNRVRFVVFRRQSGCALGFLKQSTNVPVAAAGCLLVPEPVHEVIATLSERLAAQRRMPLRVESLEVRHSTAFGTIMLTHKAGAANKTQALELCQLFHGIPNVVGQVVTAGEGRRAQRWVDRQDWIADRLDQLNFRISDRSFMQANWLLTETVAHTVVDWIAPAPGLRVLELYAGIGILGLPLARRGALVTEVEANSAALADARHAAKTNHIGRCRFRLQRVEDMLKDVQPGEYDVILVNPPRTGLTPPCSDQLIRLASARILYLSSDAPTLARDLGRLCGAGYRLARIQPFDLFPQTAQLEMLAELVR